MAPLPGVRPGGPAVGRSRRPARGCRRGHPRRGPDLRQPRPGADRVLTPPGSEHRFIGAANTTGDNIAPHGPP
ncbi:hypothetical protein D0Z08_31355 [Nocardioides immobilis]|uniref:Uncharacterized protein n=1 Tax=Nocardioides immobilis TaxID=2049295 RepID=A0A417XS15_9ACTN|nr:hypothetical protein D0Z08_31355 [Nocardioides immobilis]